MNKYLTLFILFFLVSCQIQDYNQLSLASRETELSILRIPLKYDFIPANLDRSYFRVYQDTVHSATMRISHSNEYPMSNFEEVTQEDKYIWMHAQMPTDCSLVFDRKINKSKKKIITNSVVIQEGKIHFQKKLFLYSKSKNVAEILLTFEYPKDITTLKEIMLAVSDFDDLEVRYN